MPARSKSPVRLRPTGSTAPRLFAALGDGTRWRLVIRLGNGVPLSISQLSDGESITRQAVSKHLRVLSQARVVRSRRHGRECLWELRSDQLAHAQAELSRISAQWERALHRLKQFVEEG